MKNSLINVDNLDTVMVFAEKIANTQLVPPNFRGKPEDIMVAMQMGKEVGLLPMQSLQSISVINGKPSMYGDSLLALCRSHPEFVDIEEKGDDRQATCTVKRKNQTPVVSTFTIEQANRAGLVGRSPVWKTYPERMLQMRARGFALRDAFPDALGGMITTEELNDYPVKEKPKNPMNVIVQDPAAKSKPKIEMTEMVSKEKLEKNFNTGEIAKNVIDKIPSSKKKYKVYNSLKNQESYVEFETYDDAYKLYEKKRNEILTSSAKDKNKYLQIFMQMNNVLLKNNKK